MTDKRNQKIKYLLLSLAFDIIGSLSFFIPGIGEFTDVIWAPLAGWLMTRMYKGNIGKVAGVVTFFEEILPVSDIIPSFTLMWLYTFVIKKGKEQSILTQGSN
jgi:hypothetical protein